MSPRVEIVSETGSTSADLLARLEAGHIVPEGHWLVADRQHGGRGRQGRAWLDAAGNFMGSTVVRLLPADPPPASLSFVAALAVYEAVLMHVATPQALQLKWPNDLLLAGAKLAGILLERAADSAVVGVGVNLAAAPGLEGRLVRHLGESGPAPDRDTFARDLALSFGRELQAWRQEGTIPLFRRWLAAAHPLGTVLTVHGADGTPVTGQFDGIASDGALCLRLADGEGRVIHAGDVTIAPGRA